MKRAREIDVPTQLEYIGSFSRHQQAFESLVPTANRVKEAKNLREQVGKVYLYFPSVFVSLPFLRVATTFLGNKTSFCCSHSSGQSLNRPPPN